MIPGPRLLRARLLPALGLAGVVALGGAVVVPQSAHAPAAPTTGPGGAVPAPAAGPGTGLRPAAGPTGPAGATPRPDAATRREQAVRRAVAAALRGRRGTVDVAITDVGAQQVVRTGTGRPVRTASLVKLLVLRAAQARGPLTRARRELATSMITRSDNAATTALWRASGRDRGVAGAAAALGLRDTTRVPVLLLPWDGWQTSAEDQVRLLRAIAVGRDAGSAFTRSLMAQVVAEQAWGVGAVPGATGVKNGWVPVRGRWVVNSDGCVAARGRRLCLSVLSSGSRSFGEGVRTVELAAAAAVRAWG